MNRKAQSGIVLIITLIMLAAVTFMAVIFLGVSRRERSSVLLSHDQTVAKLMNDAAKEDAQAKTLSRMAALGNKLNIDFHVSTNYINPAGFQSGVASPDNVSYVDRFGVPITGDDLLQNIANLQYDARPPVFVPTNANGATEFRFYLDFNRNRKFEDSGSVPLMNANGTYTDTNGTPTANVAKAVYGLEQGDPAWKGVLERPNLPHSETNKFIGRYAYMVLPAGKSLDLNFIHNQSSTNSDDDILGSRANNGYLRNQGHGSWELNMAGFLRALNTNVWDANSYQDYNPLNPSLFPRGSAFNDARALLSFRYNGLRSNLKSANANFSGATAFQLDGIDNYADGPFPLYPQTFDEVTKPGNRDVISRPWPGSDNTNAFYDVQEVFTHAAFSPPMADFVTRMQASMANRKSSYDRYTYYRMLAQMGVDSAPAIQGKVHLNYANEIGTISTNLVPWTNALSFFTKAANQMLRASVTTNYYFDAKKRRQTNYFLGDTYVRPDISITNIQLYHTPSQFQPFNTSNEYGASLHRILQVAANIYDNLTNQGSAYPYFPSVFRPIFTKTATNVYISGFIEATNANFTANPWFDLHVWGSQTNSDLGLHTNLNIYGQPVVIGAKKGLPNFNEFSLETTVQVARKLELRKIGSTNSQPSITNQMYILGISNVFGVEAWNSYTQNFNRRITIAVTNTYTMALSNTIGNFGNLIRITNENFAANIVTNVWPGNTNNPRSLAGTFLIPIHATPTFITNSAYLTNFPWFASPTSTNSFQSGYEPPQWTLYITNRVQYFVIDQDSKRILDFVNLDRLTTSNNISSAMVGETNGTATLFAEQGIKEGDFWKTNRLAGPGSMTLGEYNQIAVSLGQIPVSDAFWRSFNFGGNNREKAYEIDLFRTFCRTNPLPSSTNRMRYPPSLAHQAPFTPTRVIYMRRSWQANDPLVHYMPADLASLYGNVTKVIRPQTPTSGESNLRRINESYRPWGGGPNHDPANDKTAMDMTIKDPGIRRSDDWAFPITRTETNYYRFASIGLLGQVHRGTPWQTIYLKSGVAVSNVWPVWSGSAGTHPTNDWKLMDLFTVAPNENAARGLLSVNQTHAAAWNAVLAGVPVLSNSVPNAAFLSQPALRPEFATFFIEPASPHVSNIVQSINNTRMLDLDRNTGRYFANPSRVYTNLGQILSTPSLTMASPYLNLSAPQLPHGLTDDVVERIPQQILSLLKTDEPRFVIYSFGQALRPADRSISVSGNFYGLCTNYQVTGEVITKTVVRVEGELNDPNNPLRSVVESYNVLPPPE